MVTIFGTTYYTIGTGLVVLVLLAPLLFWLSRWLLRPNVEDKPRRVRLLAEGGLTLGLLLLAAVGLYWDVYLIGQRAKEACEQTGLVVFRTEPANSFIGSSDIEYWSKFGFEFVEDTVGSKRFKFSLEDGKGTREEIKTFQSRFQLVIDSDLRAVDRDEKRLPVKAHIDKVVDIRNETELGQLAEYKIGWGWVDRTLIRLTGLMATPAICGKDMDGNIVVDARRLGLDDLVRSVLVQ